MDACFFPCIFSATRKGLWCAFFPASNFFFQNLTRKLTSMSGSPDNLVSSTRSGTGPTVLNSTKETDMPTPSHRHRLTESCSPTSFWPLLLGFTSIFIAYFFARKDQPAATLSEVYALCSEQANKVYIVDRDNSMAQCIVVDGSYIADVGSLSEWYSEENRRPSTFSTHFTRNDQK